MAKHRAHYETLGVAPSASPQEIKRAYRKRAEKAHPDKGGNRVEMAALNRAYGVLIDPGLRSRYDSTGEDSVQPFEQQVNTLIMMAFTDALSKDAPHVLDHAKQSVESARAKVVQQRDDALVGQKTFKARRDKISRKSGMNAFHALIDQQLSVIEQALLKFENDLKVCDAAAKELKQYKSTEEAPRQSVMYVYPSSFGTAASAGTY